MSAMDYPQVAHLYDTYVKTNIDIPFFINEAQNCGRVLELTSGTGRLSIPLIESGVSLTCVDNSPEMLRILHQKLAAKGFHKVDLYGDYSSSKFQQKTSPFTIWVLAKNKN